VSESKSLEKFLLEIGAFVFSPDKPFTWASGIISPVYCDNRLTLSYPPIRTFIKEAFVSLIKDKLSDVDAIAGVATAGIPYASLLADQMNLPLLYVRPAAKDHGKKNKVEGRVESKHKIVVVEDLLSTGQSSLAAAEELRALGCEVMGVVAIFSYNMSKMKAKFEEAHLRYFTLTDYDRLSEMAVKLNYLPAKDLEGIMEWRDRQ